MSCTCATTVCSDFTLLHPHTACYIMATRRGTLDEAKMSQVVVLQSDGRMKPEELESLAEMATAGCRAAGALIRTALFDNTRKLAIARGPVAF